MITHLTSSTISENSDWVSTFPLQLQLFLQECIFSHLEMQVLVWWSKDHWKMIPTTWQWHVRRKKKVRSMPTIKAKMYFREYIFVHAPCSPCLKEVKTSTKVPNFCQNFFGTCFMCKLAKPNISDYTCFCLFSVSADFDLDCPIPLPFIKYNFSDSQFFTNYWISCMTTTHVQTGLLNTRTLVVEYKPISIWAKKITKLMKFSCEANLSNFDWGKCGVINSH